MTVWADADALPATVRDVISRRAERILARDIAKTPGSLPRMIVVFVSCKPLKIATSSCVSFLKVEEEPQASDILIKSTAKAGDLAVTRDIPLASELLQAGISVISHFGEEFTPDTIGAKLARRDIMLDLRLSGIVEPKGSNYGPKELKSFSDGFDRILSRLI